MQVLRGLIGQFQECTLAAPTLLWPTNMASVNMCIMLEGRTIQQELSHSLLPAQTPLAYKKCGHTYFTRGIKSNTVRLFCNIK